jgi:hypothetical protein
MRNCVTFAFNVKTAAENFALQRPLRRARGRGRTAVDQVGNGFGLAEVELVVDEGTARELAGFGPSGAKRNDARHEQFADDRAAVRVQFEYIFAGV